MKEIKYRWNGADGSLHVRKFEVPDAAQKYMGEDKYGRQVWEEDILKDEYGNEVIAGYLTLPLEQMEKVHDEIVSVRPSNRKDVWK